MSENSPKQLSKETLLAKPGAKFVLVAARFNAHVVDELVDRAREALRDHQVASENIRVLRVPGVFELPLACQWALAEPDVVAAVALGAVIRGDTPHFDFVAGEGARGCMDAMLRTNKPVVFGVLTTNDEAQALQRSDAKRGDKGYEAGLAALEMLAMQSTLRGDV